MTRRRTYGEVADSGNGGGDDASGIGIQFEDQANNNQSLGAKWE
jgi:hypothetical protein